MDLFAGLEAISVRTALRFDEDTALAFLVYDDEDVQAVDWDTVLAPPSAAADGDAVAIAGELEFGGGDRARVRKIASHCSPRISR